MAPAVRAAERRRNESPLPVPRSSQYWVGTFSLIMTWLSAGISSRMLSCAGTLDLYRSPQYCAKESIKRMDGDGITNRT